MGLEIHKPGQGKFARGGAYLLCGLLVLFGAVRLYATINEPGRHVWIRSLPVLGDVSLYKAIAVVVFFLGLLAVHLFLNREKNAELLIDTEQELRKVSWPSWREVKNATVVVVIVTVIMAVALFGFDRALQHVFHLIF